MAIAALIADLRGCESPADYDDFQRELFRHIWETETRRSEVRRCLKRLRRGERLPATRPQLGNGLPPDEVESWRYEDLTYERLGRQLRCVGDALVWRVTRFDRAFMLAISRNESAGPIVNKVGLNHELGAITELFRDRGHFVLLNDLTNCVRIGDATEFTADGRRVLHEVKKTGRKDARQMERMQQVVDALMQGAPLPGAPSSRIIRLATPLRAHLTAFSDAVAKSQEKGLAGLVVPRGSRALISASFPVMMTKPNEAWDKRWDAERARLQRRLRLFKGTDELVLNTGDTAARAPGMAPFGIFPISPGHVAQLVCDLLIVETRMPATALRRALEDRGLTVDFPIGGRDTEVTPSQASFHVHRGNQSITLHGNAVAQLLYEHTALDTLADSIVEVFDLADPPVEPVPVNADEDQVWV